jgi:hypothetical protein
MGGNALKHLNPVRLTSAEVIDLVHHLHRNWQLVDSRPLYLVPWVAEKQDHGDIDVICEADPETVLRFAQLIGADTAKISRNDKVLSTPVALPGDSESPSPRICQVDFICCSSEDAAATRFFYAGGDFGMLLGRVAAWQGLVFGMDGLRYRAERDVHWQSDVHLTADPAEILSVLGYQSPLPWFDTYDRLWRYMLSSPLAGAWMFSPEATNHENRSRDRQRRKVGDFQDWLAENYPEQLVARAPRRTSAEAREWVRVHYPAVNIDETLRQQEARFNYVKMRTRVLGMGAVEDVVGPGHDPEILGKIVHGMQALLPPKAERDMALADPVRWGDIILLARAAATAVAITQGMKVQVGPPIPPYCPPA